MTATAVNALGLLLVGLLLLAGAHPAEFVFIGWIFALPWLLALTMSAMSPGWRTREKAASILFFPTLLVGLAVVAAILRPAIGPGAPVTVAVMAAVVLGAAWTLVLLVRKALR